MRLTAKYVFSLPADARYGGAMGWQCAFRNSDFKLQKVITKPASFNDRYCELSNE